MTERQSPLHRIHVDAGATFTDFAGWQMPVRYSSDLAEHHAVRTAAGIFDISHMAEITVGGPDAARFLDYALAGDIGALPLQRAKYSLLLDAGGGVIDDLIVYHNAQGEYFVVANAANRDAVVTALEDRASGFDVGFADVTDNIALIAVQGPRALEILQATEGFEVDDDALAALKYYACMDAQFNGVPVLVGRTGYTGEDGFELFADISVAEEFWHALVAAGTPTGLVPAGLASRDTLRLEAGMALYGHELGLDTYPAQAGLGRVVALGKDVDFVGRAAVEAGPAEGARVLVGLASEGKRAGRAGYDVLSGDRVVGTVTSGALSPTLGHPIAMAYVDPDLAAVGTQLELDVRGSRVPASVVPLPFYKREK